MREHFIGEVSGILPDIETNYTAYQEAQARSAQAASESAARAAEQELLRAQRAAEIEAHAKEAARLLAERRAIAGAHLPDLLQSFERTQVILEATGIAEPIGTFLDQYKWLKSQPIAVAEQDGIRQEITLTTMAERIGRLSISRQPRAVLYQTTLRDTRLPHNPGKGGSPRGLWLGEDGTFGESDVPVVANELDGVLSAIENQLGIER